MSSLTSTPIAPAPLPHAYHAYSRTWSPKSHLPWGLTCLSRVVCVQGKSMDARLISEEPDLVMAHLNARKASDEQRASVTEIAGHICIYVYIHTYIHIQESLSV